MSTTKERTVEVPTEKLRLGMYVVLPSGWMNHPFLKNQFLLKNSDDLNKIKSSNIKTVLVVPSKSKIEKTSKPAPNTKHPNEDSASSDQVNPWTPETLVPAELQEALLDVKAQPEVRSKAVYTHSKELMSRLLESPTAMNLKASKEAINSITDLILSEDQVSKSMLKITSHDFYTYTHSVNVGVMGIMMAKAMFKKSDGHDLHELGSGFFLHDLGKVKIRSEVINKPGRLTDEEMSHMQAHPELGFRLLKEFDQLSEEARVIILQHHERADGSGYPNGIHGEEIHIYGKICCIADIFDALTSERSYKKALTTFQALKVMKENMSSHFDNKLFNSFVDMMR